MFFYIIWGYCVLALTLNRNCNFTLIFSCFMILPLFFKIEEQNVTVSNKLREDKFAPLLL
jgi:hypothetical protein